MSEIVVAEDDAGFRTLLEEVLVQDGHAVRVAQDGLEALRLVRERAPDLVICDLIMPTMEGVELLFALRSQFPSVRCVAISGGGRLGSASYLAIAAKAGAAATLEKPFTAAQLREAVSAALR